MWGKIYTLTRLLKKEKEKTTTHPVTSTSTASFHCYIWCVFLSCFSIYLFFTVCTVSMYMLSMWSVYVGVSELHITHSSQSLHEEKKRFFQTKINGETSVFWTFLRWKSVFFQGGPCVCVSIHNHPFSCVTQKTKTQMNQTGTARFTVVHQHVCALPYWKRLDRTSTRSYTHVP